MARTAAQKAWDQRNAALIRERRRAAYWADPEKARAHKRVRQARYRKRHPERVRAGLKANYQANRPARLASALAYQKANLATTVRANRHNRRARMKAAPGRITKRIVASIRAAQGDLCAYCKTNLHGGGHLDHKVALSRGGTNLPDNLQWLCQPCNLAKYTTSHDEYLARAA
jgi:5-methylcytosine-specific restriction endonuclease McrA